MFNCRIDDDIVLQLLEENHAGELFALTERSRDHLRRWLPWVDATQTVEDSRNFIVKSLEQYNRNEAMNAGIWYHGKLAGIISFARLDLHNKNAMIGFWIGKEYEGKGLMTRSCKALIEKGFGEMGLNRIELTAALENRRSRAIPERLGFQLEGVLRQSTWLYDHFQDMAIYSLLRSEWARV